MLLLDGSVTPYLPTQKVLQALEAPPERTPAELALMLRDRLALLHGISARRIALLPNDGRVHSSFVKLRPESPVAWYPPTARITVDLPIDQVIAIERSTRFRIESAQVDRTPSGATAVVITPNDPTGNAISLTTAAALARRAGLLVIEEQSAEMQRRSSIPLVSEFESIALVRSFSDWAGLGVSSPAYAITTPCIAAAIDRSSELDATGLQGALAAVSNAAQLDAVAHRVRLERLRLYRMLRKLNFLRPFPSDAGFVLAEITRGDRESVARALFEREISVFAPAQPELRQTLRFAAISPVATRRLQQALVEISRDVIV